MANIKITDTETLTNERFTLKKINFELQKEDGAWHNQSRLVFSHGNAAAALLYNKDKQTIILTEQFRLPTFLNGNPSGMLLEVPAGLLDADEDAADTIKREITEETGYEVTDVQKVYETYTSPGSLTELLYLYIAEYEEHHKTGEGGGLQHEGEHITVIEMPFHEATQQLHQGKIRDSKTIMLLQYAMLNGIIK
ncbi:NUDIX domain-containing protein [Chitinophagaceae bacterium LB-8]|uniref:GDP-mannose pyrophosphatase n=1 Tax=Paraflavisolibacter caeni TaxID=2982496 RepID=A0A9X3B9G6_9BACT|nr:NUDIX domain-containing protein [Paraflavisolibacter caeni]MCU7551256.1 NUDIX domain-containing protein [Paraflavisolibacter caeni]